MKRIFYISFLAFWAGVPMAMAQQSPMTTTTTTSTWDFPWDISVQGGGLWAKDNARLHDGSEVIGRMTYDLTPNVGIGAETGGIRFLDETNGTHFGHLYGVPLMADLELKIPVPGTGNRLVPYVFGGAGAIFWNYNKSDFSDHSGVQARERTHFAARPGLGVDYYLTPNMAVFVEGSYLYSPQFELKNGSSSPPDGKLDVDSAYAGGGIKIAF